MKYRNSLRGISVKKLKSFPIDKLAIVSCGLGVLTTGQSLMATTEMPTTTTTGLVEWLLARIYFC